MSNQHSNSPFQPADNGKNNGSGYTPGEYYQGQPILDDSSNNDEIDLKLLLATMLRHKWWVAGITVAITLIAGIYAFAQQPVYQSSGTMLIAEERNRYTWAGTDLSSMMSSSFGVGTGSRLTNELQVLQSRRLANEIADKLLETERMENGEIFPILWYEYPGDSTIVARTTVSSRIINNMNVDRTSQDTDVLRISFSSFSPLEAQTLVDLTMETYTEVSAAQSRMAANSAINFLEREMEDIENKLASAEEQLRDYMSNTNLVQIDGQTSAVINRMAELESQRQQVEVQRVAINSSIESYENQLERIRPGLAEQLSENISGQLERVQYRLADLRTERSLMLQRNPALRNNPEMEPQFVQLEEDIEGLRQEIRMITSDLMNADDSDIFIGFLDQEDGGVTSRILELRRNLIELRIEESQLNAQETAIEQRMAQENEFFDGLPQNMLELARLRRDVQINEELYTTISNQYAETQLWEQTQYGSGRPIDFGQFPTSPSAPNKKLYLLIGFMIGGIMSIGFVFTKESFNKTIDGTEKLRKTGYPLLAVIPNFNEYVRKKYKGEEFVSVKDHQVSTSWSSLLDSISPISESYRRLHNNIIYSDPDAKYQTILVTSSRKGEGKSTVSINLAVALAESGKKVLLIDNDLRRPNLHRLTGVAREPGIAEIFYDDQSKNSAIKPTIAPGLHIITSGKSIPNPAALLQSERMKNFMNQLKDRYDHIIVDTPPYGVITDSAPMMQHVADGVILVSKFGETQINELYHTVDNLKKIRAKVIGTVLTAYKHRESADYYYYNEYTYDSYHAYEEYQES